MESNEKELIDFSGKGYRPGREKIVKEYFEQVGIKPFNENLYKIAIKCSELPVTKTSSGNYEPAYEQSLFEAGLVYRAEGTLSVVGMDGHTYLMPDHPAVVKELADCGYLICGYHSTYPDDVNPQDLYAGGEKYIDAAGKIREYRDRYTPSGEIYEKIRMFEINSYPSKVKGQEDDYSYDIFGEHTAENPSLTAPQFLGYVLEYYGLDMPQTRKFLVVSGGYDGSAAHTEEEFANVDEFINFVLSGPVLNDEKYFAPGGLREEYRNILGERSGR